MKHFNLILIAMLFIMKVHAQNALVQSTKRDSLKIGDGVPDITLSFYKNYQKSTAKISDFKGKLLILDFWGRGCSSCIQGMPKMERLQNEFGDKIQILLVTMDTEKDLSSLFQHSPNVKATKLPMIIDDTALHRMFPFFGLPYHIWINGDGRVIAANHGYSTTSGNIRLFLEQGRLDNVTTEMSFLQNPLQPLQAELEKLAKTGYLKSFSFLAKKDPNQSGRSNGSHFDSYGNVTAYFNWMGTALELYKDALLKKGYRFVGNLTSLKIIVELREKENSDLYYPPSDPNKFGKWFQESGHTYWVNSGIKYNKKDSLSEKKFGEYMRKDLDNRFGLNSSVERKQVKCLVLKRIGSTDKLSSKGGERIHEPNIDGIWIIRNVHFAQLITSLRASFGDLSQRNDSHVIVDETGIDPKKKIDMDIKIQKGISLAEVQKTFHKYGLSLKEEFREVECLVLKEI